MIAFGINTHHNDLIFRQLIEVHFSRLQEAEDHEKSYKNYYQEKLFPVLTERYTKKYGGSFPLSGKDLELHEEKFQLLCQKTNCKFVNMQK